MTAIYEPKGMAREYSELACNLYAGCTHGCIYCYAPSCLQRKRTEFHATAKPRNGIIEALEKDLKRGRYEGQGRVLFCFTSDPYQPAEDQYRIASRALYLMHREQVAFQVLTKGGTRACRDFGYYERGMGVFGTTLAYMDDAQRREWEPNAAPVENRIEALAEAHRQNIRTWVSIEPVIDPAQALELISALDYCVDEWRVGKLNHHAHARTVDWAAFAIQVQDLLVDSGKDFLIKDALAAFLPADRKHLIRRNTRNELPRPNRQEAATTLF